VYIYLHNIPENNLEREGSSGSNIRTIAADSKAGNLIRRDFWIAIFEIYFRILPLQNGLMTVLKKIN
jgi:hypothetical protein